MGRGQTRAASTARMLTLFAGCLALSITPWLQAHAQVLSAPATSTFPVSSPQQPTSDFAREWRRVERLIQACGSNEQYQNTITAMIDALIQQKLAQRQMFGSEDADYTDRKLSRRDRIRPSPENCQAVGAPAYGLTATYLSYVDNGLPSPIFRAPILD